MRITSIFMGLGIAAILLFMLVIAIREPTITGTTTITPALYAFDDGCASDADCAPKGCFGEWCSGVGRNVKAECEGVAGSSPKESGYSCQCVDGACKWRK